MKTWFPFQGAVLAICLMASPAIANGQRLYPVAGPAATQAPPPDFTAKLTNYLSVSGKITLKQSNGESFEGTWKTVTITFVAPGAAGAPASYPPQPNLAAAWDLVYGQGYFVANILGSQTIGQAIANGSNGTVLQLEFHKEKLGLPPDLFFGVAIDNKGNIYKVVL